MKWMDWLLSAEVAGGEHGPGNAEGEQVWGWVIGNEDMFVTEAEVEREVGVWENIPYTEACGHAGEFLVLFASIGVVLELSVGIQLRDIGGADAIAGKGFEIETRAAVIESMAVAEEEGEEDHVGLAGGEIVETDLTADLVAFCHGKAYMEISAETGVGLSFCENLSDFQLSVERCAYAYANGKKG